MLDEIFMWLKKLSLLKFNKKVAATQLVETSGYFKREVRSISKEKTKFKERHFLPQTVIVKQFFLPNMLPKKAVRCKYLSNKHSVMYKIDTILHMK